MRILVLSDSHGRVSEMEKAIEQQPDAETVVFLGDGARDFELCRRFLTDKKIYCVCGNNDFYCDYPRNDVFWEKDVKTYITHGHYEFVKSGLGALIGNAHKAGCKLALYGHTHCQQTDYVDGMHLFCPGALYKGEYGVVDITDKGLICIGMKTER